MKLGILYSGGKDSNYALYKASLNNEVKCLITLNSQNVVTSIPMGKWECE